MRLSVLTPSLHSTASALVASAPTRFAHFMPTTASEVGTVTVPALQMTKLQHREAAALQGAHSTFRRAQRLGSEPSLAPESLMFAGVRHRAGIK